MLFYGKSADTSSILLLKSSARDIMALQMAIIVSTEERDWESCLSSLVIFVPEEPVEDWLCVIRCQVTLNLIRPITRSLVVKVTVN